MPVITVLYDNHAAVYFPGQTVSGSVVVSSNNPFSCREIQITFIGKAEVKWEELSHNRDQSDICHTAEESYYNMKTRLWGNGSLVQIAAGSHSFPFAFILPFSLPPSFESPIGHVRHYCKAILSLPMRFDKKCSRPFTVAIIKDLNVDPISKIPISLNKFKTRCCLCCKSGPISFVVKIQHSGYVPGEAIIINAECTNQSNSVVNQSAAEIYQELTYRTADKKKQEHKKICEISRGSIPPGESDIWASIPLHIPSLPPTELPGCNIIDIRYFFKFVMDPSGFSLKLSATAPIIIGTVPLYRMFPNFAHPAPTPSAPPVAASGADLPPPYFPAVEQYPDLPPPSYAECAFNHTKNCNTVKGQDSDCEDWVEEFVPQYITYRQHPPTAPALEDDDELLVNVG